MTRRLTPADKDIRLVKERDWQNLVIQLATARGWKHYHPPDNKPVNGRIQKVVAGFPDLVLIKNGRMVFAELKREKGVLSPEQASWIVEIKACGIECYVWRPSQVALVIDILNGKKITAE
jgi:hypothetical protein